MFKKFSGDMEEMQTTKSEVKNALDGVDGRVGIAEKRLVNLETYKQQKCSNMQQRP